VPRKNILIAPIETPAFCPGDRALDSKRIVPFGKFETIEGCGVVAAPVLPADVMGVWRVVFLVDVVNSTGPGEDCTGVKDMAVDEDP
jgi:hypothetical protein